MESDVEAFAEVQKRPGILASDAPWRHSVLLDAL